MWSVSQGWTVKALSEDDHNFLKKRKRLIAIWNSIAVIMLIALVTIFSWIYIQVPYLANPLFVAEALKHNEIQESVMATSAITLPVVFITLFVTVGIFVLFGFAIFSNEKRYLSIIERLLEKRP
jgi:hypothetical protein